MFKRLLCSLTVICALSLAPCSGAEDFTSIQIKGSDTMVNLTQAWAERFSETHPDANIAVTGGGSGTGIVALINGTCELAACSRMMKPKEIAMAESKGVEPKEYVVAMDGIAVAVNPENPISELNIDQLSDIFTGKIKNWKELGGDDKRIVLLSREVNSGTHVFFKEHVLRKGMEGSTEEFAPDALLMPSSQAIADEIASNPNAIGYYGMGYISPAQKAIKVAMNNGAPYEYPSLENVRSGAYPITRPLLVYSRGIPEGMVKEFMDFIFSDEGQEIVKETEFVPIK